MGSSARASTVWPARPSCEASKGFGAQSRLHTARILRLSEDLPVVIEIVDTEEKIQAFLPAVDEMVAEGLLTIETVEVVAYRSKKSETGEAGAGS